MTGIDVWSKGPSEPGRGSSDDGKTYSDAEQAHGELSLARVALAEDDLHHAANHVAGAIGYAPALPEIHEVLAALAARGDDGGLGLFPLDSNPYIGTVVGHAHLLAPTDPARALFLLAQATEFDASKPWADAAWVRACGTEGIDPETLVRVFVTVLRALNEPVPDHLRAANQVWLVLAGHAVDAHAGHAVLQGVCSAIARRIGDPEVAVQWGRRGVELESSKLTLVWYAYALRTADRLEEALAVMHRARAQYPLDIDLSADVSSWLADSGRLDEAIQIIEDALRVDPTYDCGVHTAHRLRFRRDGDAATHLVALSDFVRSHGHVESHEHTDLADCCVGRAWLGEPAAATESTINALRSIQPEQRSGGATMHVTQMEVPSALATVDRVWPGLRITFPDPTPDLISPLSEGPVLWRYDGQRLVPAVAAPPESASALIARTVTPSWPHPVAAYDQALPLGELPAQYLLAALVHPPARPAQHHDLAEDAWIRSVQAFACLGLLHCRELGATAGDWRAPIELLTQVAYGVEDWTTEAALFGLAVAAWVQPACRAQVAQIVADRFQRARAAMGQHVVTILPGLASLVLIVPGVDEGAREGARVALVDDPPEEQSPDGS